MVDSFVKEMKKGSPVRKGFFVLFFSKNVHAILISVFLSVQNDFPDGHPEE